MRVLKLLCLLSCVAIFGLAMQGCQVNVIMLDGVNVDASTNPYNYIEAQLPDVAEYDCAFAPAADECQ